MARFNYSSYLKKEEKKGTGDYKVSYFGLKDDGDEATVRFVYNSTEEFHLVTVHAVEVDGKQRRVSWTNEKWFKKMWKIIFKRK